MTPARTGIKPKWTAADIPDQTGRTAIVTGANSGTGYEIALQLATRGAHVVLASRDLARTSDAVRRIKEAVTGSSVEAQLLDLASLSSICRFAEGFSSRHRGLDILVNNAGAAGGPRRDTVDGFEAHFQVNYLGHFALTARLLPLLKARPGARVVSVSSEIAASGRIDLDDLQSSRRYSFVSAYAQSKLANLLFAQELARRARSAEATVGSFAAHPGVAKSNLLIDKQGEWGRSRRGMESVVRFAQLLLAQSAAIGALPALYQATDPAARSGAYVGPSGGKRGYPRLQEIPRAALDSSVAARLWDVSCELARVEYRFTEGGLRQPDMANSPTTRGDLETHEH